MSDPQPNIFFVSETKTSRKYYLSAETKKDKDAWLKAINNRIDALKARKSSALANADEAANKLQSKYSRARGSAIRFALFAARHIELQLQLSGTKRVEEQYKSRGDRALANNNGEEASKYYTWAVELNPFAPGYTKAIATAAKVSMKQLLLSGKELKDEDAYWVTEQVGEECLPPLRNVPI